MPLKPAQQEFLRFCVVGGVGFVCDAGATMALVQGAGLGAAAARVLAFVFAATVTWALNRSFTFRHEGSGGRWLPYLLSTGLGALLSLGVYLAWISMAGKSALQLLVGVALGSVVALFFNFTVAKRLIFKTGQRAG